MWFDVKRTRVSMMLIGRLKPGFSMERFGLDKVIKFLVSQSPPAYGEWVWRHIPSACT